MTKQSKALQLADELEKYEIFCPDLDEVAAELRRLHEVNQELLMALKMGVDETLDYIRLNHLTGAENNQWIVLAQAAIAKGETT